MWKAVARTITRMQMILHLNRGRPWHVVKKSQLAKVALAVVFKHLHKSPWTVLSTFSLWMFVDHIWYSFLVSIKESRKKQIFQGQADRKRLPPLRSAFCDFLCVFFWPYIMILCVLHKKKPISIQLLESPIPPLTAAALRMIICKRPAPQFNNQERAWKMHFWDSSQWDKMCFECQRIKFQWKKGSTFS